MFENGFYFTPVTSNGRTGKEWATHYEKRGFILEDEARKILCSDSFIPTNGITFKVAYIDGDSFPNDERKTRDVVQRFGRASFRLPTMEIGCLIADKFLDENTYYNPFRLVVLHEPVKDSLDQLVRLAIHLRYRQILTVWDDFDGGPDYIEEFSNDPFFGSWEKPDTFPFILI